MVLENSEGGQRASLEVYDVRSDSSDLIGPLALLEACEPIGKQNGSWSLCILNAGADKWIILHPRTTTVLGLVCFQRNAFCFVLFCFEIWSMVFHVILVALCLNSWQSTNRMK